MLSFDLKPSEEIYEIEFEGVFIPQKFDPLWFFNNGLLGEEEAKSANIVKVEEDEILVFSTKFIRIIVEKEKFRIGTAQLLSLDLIKDMAVSIANILKDSLTGRFSYDLQLHIRFSNKKRLKQALNSIGGVDHWKGVLENPQSYSFRVIDESNLDTSKIGILANVTIKNTKNGAQMKYQIVAEEESDLKLGKISIKSPIGKGLLGKKLGETAEIDVPAGKMEFEIIDISF